MQDERAVDPKRETKSISAETTFNTDLTGREDLERTLWHLSEKLGRRLREGGFAAGGVVLKLKTSRFASRTRAARLPMPTRLPDRLFEAARALLIREVDGTAYRLIGIGASPLLPGGAADLPDLSDPESPRRVAAQTAIDSLRSRFGSGIIAKGRGLPR